MNITLTKQTLNEIQKAIICLTEPTRLNIATHLGLDNPANICRRIYGISIERGKRGYSLNQYNLIMRHITRMKNDGVIHLLNPSKEVKVKNYELTELGKEALTRKGYKVLSRY